MKWYTWLIVIVIIGIIIYTAVYWNKNKNYAQACLNTSAFKACVANSDQPSGEAAVTDCVNKLNCQFKK